MNVKRKVVIVLMGLVMGGAFLASAQDKPAGKHSI